MTNQPRRYCASIPANIAEGSGKNGYVELCLFLQITMSSDSGLKYHLLLTRNLNLIKSSTGKISG
ncbi:MAG: four helix bundle protein [Trichodesmium sp. MO_231.B1]|nr:four helix bundle protein [Trichodesmium sp. MO_231.B1]